MAWSAVTVVGSRQTPMEPRVWLAEEVTDWLSQATADGTYFAVRTGTADGADAAAREGWATAWERHQRGIALVYGPHDYVVQGAPWSDVAPRTDYSPIWWEWAEGVARTAHPAWDRCSAVTRNLLTRNVAQVVGAVEGDPRPSLLLLCWTPDGAETAAETSPLTGGTGQTIRIADRFGVPVVNMGREGWRERLTTAVILRMSEVMTVSVERLG